MALLTPGDRGRPSEPARDPVTVRARVAPRPEPPYDRLFDPITQDLVADGPLARERFAVRWSDTAALQALARAKLAPLAAPLAAELAEYHRRLGASPRSLESLERLARGEAVCAVAGQQPAPLGGPLYSLHKTATAAGLATVITERTGVPCVPLFWMHGEDSDFDEIRSATFADAGLTLRERALPDDAHAAGGLVGSIPAAPLAALGEEALQAWAGLAGHGRGGRVAAGLARAGARPGRGVQRPDAGAVRRAGPGGGGPAAARVPRRRAAGARALPRARRRNWPAAARQAGAWLEARTGRRPLSDAALESFVFAIEDGARRKLSPAEARARPGGRDALAQRGAAAGRAGRGLPDAWRWPAVPARSPTSPSCARSSRGWGSPPPARCRASASPGCRPRRWR